MPNLTRIVGLVALLYKRSGYCQKIRPGPVPQYSDPSILQMVVVQHLQLKDHLGLEKLRAKSDKGVEARIQNILFSYLMAVAYNKTYKRNLLSIKGILS